MPSPFPGMDPYIESWIWGDFHGRMIVNLHDQLNPRLPKRYIVSTDLYIWREEVSDLGRQMLGGPDLFVADRSPAAQVEVVGIHVLAGDIAFQAAFLGIDGYFHVTHHVAEAHDAPTGLEFGCGSSRSDSIYSHALPRVDFSFGSSGVSGM